MALQRILFSKIKRTTNDVAPQSLPLLACDVSPYYFGLGCIKRAILSTGMNTTECCNSSTVAFNASRKMVYSCHVSTEKKKADIITIALVDDK